MVLINLSMLAGFLLLCAFGWVVLREISFNLTLVAGPDCGVVDLEVGGVRVTRDSPNARIQEGQQRIVGSIGGTQIDTVRSFKSGDNYLQLDCHRGTIEVQ